MPLRDDIKRVTAESINRLNAAYDFFAHTSRAWRSVQDSVVDGEQMSWHSEAEHSFIAGPQIVALSQRYVEEDLTSASFQQFVSIFENYLSDVLRLWLTRYPDFIARRQISGREILALPDKAAVIDSLIEKELRDVFYDRPARWFTYLDERVNLGAPSAEQRDQFVEIKATRDVIVHGIGVANAYYVDKAGPAARAGVGELLDVPGPYHFQSWQVIRKLTADIGEGMSVKA